MVGAAEARYVGQAESKEMTVVAWEHFEATWFDAIVDAIVATARSNPGEQFYAGAIWLLHGDYSSILPPAFGLNVESSAADVRWHPPDWRWSPIDHVHERVRALYEPLAHLQVDECTFDALWERHLNALASVARRATVLVREGKTQASVTPAFFVGIIDFSQGDDALDYLQRSVDEHLLAASGILQELSS